MQVSIPRPNIDKDIQPFWDALQEHKFKLLQCKKCGAWCWPFAYCRMHPSTKEDMEWVEASGKGEVFVFNIHYWAFHPAFKASLPYVYALVQMEEGPMLGTNIVNCDVNEVRIGMPVQVVYEEHQEEGFILPKFEPSNK